MSSPSDVFILIHGTFARRALWTKSASPLFNAMQRLVPTAEITRFEWSGKNSHRARLQGGDELKKLVEASVLRNPTARHTVIAHSHGGNVLLYALRDPLVSKAISKAVFLGTPFLTCNPRNFELALSFAAGCLKFFVPVLLWIILIVVQSDDPKNHLLSFFKRIYEDYDTYLYVLLFGLGVYWSVASSFVNAGIDKLKQVISSRLQNRQLMLLRKLAPEEFQAPCLVVTTRLDEPYWWLRGWVGAAALPHLLWGVLGTCTKSLPILIGLVILTQCTADSWVSEKDAFNDMGLLTSSILGVLTLYLSTMLIFVVMLVFPPIFVGPWAFGWSGFLGTWLLKVTPSNLPAGSMRSCATILHYNNRPRGILRLRHSALHSDPSAIDAVANWLRSENPVSGHPASDSLGFRSNDSVVKLPYLRVVCAAIGILAGAFVITRNFYLQQQLPINEALPELHSEAIQIKASTIILVSITQESLSPGKSITRLFDLTKPQNLASCFVVGDYESNNSSLMILMVAAVWAPIPTNYKLGDPPYNLISHEAWDRAGGESLVPRKRQPSGPDHDNGGGLKSIFDPKAMMEGLIESTSTAYRTLYSSSDHEHRKKVHFERKLNLGDQDIRGSGVVIKNRGKQERAIFDLNVSAVCPSA